MRKLKRPLSPDAVRKADAAVGRKLTMSAADAPDRKKWLAAYRAATGEGPPAEPPARPKPPASPVQPCPASAICKKLYAEITKLNVAEERAKLADDVYNRYDPARAPGEAAPPPPEGYTRVSDDPKAMKALFDDQLSDQQIKDLTHPDNSSYRAAVYRNQEGKTFVVFRGTENKEGLKDWKANATQGIGRTHDHYEKAKQLSQKVAGAAGADSTEVIGHSKGGAMAAAGGLTAGVKTTTFNSAGLHPNTVPGIDLAAADKVVDSYVVDGEILDTVQGKGSPKSVGDRTNLPAILPEPKKLAWYDVPGHVGQQFDRQVGQRVTLHGMAKVNAGIEDLRAGLRAQYAGNGCPAQLGPV